MDVICMICLAWAIAQVETGGDPDEVGGAGERTLYQFTADTWGDYSRVPIAAADGDEVDRVFREHTAWIAGRIAAGGQDVTVEKIARIWNAGYGRWRDGRVPAATLDYAERVGNLYRWGCGMNNCKE